MIYKKVVVFIIILFCSISFLPINAEAVNSQDTISIAAGKYHSMVAMEDGRLFVWGDNSKGQIGNGTKNQQNTPVQIMENVSAVAAGDYSSYALTYSGDLYAWGDNSHGECGTSGTDSYISEPIRIMKNVVSIAATKTHAYAVSSSGDLYFMGESGYAGYYPLQGIVDFTYRQPSGISAASTPAVLLNGVKEVYCYDASTSIVKTDGTLWCWSRYFDNSYQQIDSYTTTNEYGDSLLCSTWLLTPVKVAESASAVTPYGNIGMFLDSNDNLYSWRGPSLITLPDELIHQIDDISSNGLTNLFVANNGDLYADGVDSYGLIGTGNSRNIYSTDPVVITRDVVKACVGQYHAILVKKNGEIWTWGTNEYGQLGNGTALNYNVPFPIMDGDGSNNDSGINNPFSVVFDGKKMSFDVEPVIRNGRALVPFRAIFEELGADVSWNAETDTATATKGEITIDIVVDSDTAFVNGEPVILDTTAEIVLGRTMVPLRFISESMNCIVSYIASDNIADIRTESAYNLYCDEVKQKLIGYNAYIEVGENGSSSYYAATGVVIDPSGIILTNKHVTEGTDWIRTTINGVTYTQSEIIYEDETLDYAIYRLTNTAKQFAVPQLGDSSRLVTGSELFTCGNPDGTKNQCYRGTADYIAEEEIETNLYSQHGSSGSGVYNNSLELVGIIYGQNYQTLIVPLDIMLDKITTAITHYGVASQEDAA